LIAINFVVAAIVGVRDVVDITIDTVVVAIVAASSTVAFVVAMV